MLKNFIRTSDEETANKLRNCGFYEVDTNGKYHIFVNSDTIKFSKNVDSSKIAYTDNLVI